MAAPTITNGEEHFFPIIYSGNGTNQRVGKFVPFTPSGTISKSCLFNNYDTSNVGNYLNKASMSAGNQQVATFSAWVKFAGPVPTSGDTGPGYANLIAQGNGNWTSTANLMFYMDRGRMVWYHNSTVIFQGTMRFIDTSKWYHIMWALDVTQATASDRLKIYVDGDELVNPDTDNRSSLTQNTNVTYVNASGQQLNIGSTPSGNGYQGLHGYMAEINYVDGTALTPATFGETDTSTGRWVPKALTGISYGTNGFRMEFGSPSNLGDDTSGNTYDLSVNGLVAADQRNDTPTNNLPIMRPYNISYSQLMYEGGLTTYTNGTNKGYAMCSTLRPKGSGKYYAEVRTSGNGGGGTLAFGCYTQEDLHGVTASGNVYVGHSGSNGCGSALWYVHGGTKQLRFGSTTTSNPTVTINGGDVIGIALDLDNDKISFYDNSGSLIGSTTFDSSKSACFAAMSNMSITFIWNFGDNGTFAGNETAGGNADEDGNGNFFHSVPTGFKMLRQQGMPETAKGIPGLVWVKDRDNSSYFHTLNDSSRGSLKEIYANSDTYEATQANSLQKFLKGGYSTMSAINWNTVGNRYVAWNWVGNGGTTASNGDGSITTTTQVNSTAGFSIIQYTGTEANATIGHGLSQTPDWFMIKALESHSPNGYWIVWHKSFAANQLIYLNLSLAIDTSTSMFNNTLPTSSVINLGGNFNTNMSGNKMLCYAWHEVAGYSKFSTYTGNGSSSDGPFIYTGFRPAWVMWKATDAEGWYIYDTTRNAYNGQGYLLRPDVTNTDYDYGLSEGIIALSNGFKVYGNSGWHNTASQTYLYFAFAENPFGGDGTNPVTAR